MFMQTPRSADWRTEGSGFDQLTQGNLAYEIGQITERLPGMAEAAFGRWIAGGCHGRADRAGRRISAHQHDILWRGLPRRNLLLIRP